MKKTLLLIAIVLVSTSGINAQKSWDFSTFNIETITTNKTIDGLLIMAESTTSVAIDANTKVNGTYSFTQRCKLGGSGIGTVNRYMPITRALSFNVSGPGTITVAALSSSSSADRRLILTNGTDSITSYNAPGSYSDSGNTIPLTSYQYTGGAATLYLYSVSSGVNVYLLNATSASSVSAVKTVLTDKGVKFNGSEITNPKALELEVYNLVGTKVLTSNTTISTKNFQKGIYIVRLKGSNDAIKLSI